MSTPIGFAPAASKKRVAAGPAGRADGGFRGGFRATAALPRPFGLVLGPPAPYGTGVDYAKFRAGVVELAGEGTRLTKANVAARLRVEPAEAGALLDRMTRDGELELDIDERSGEIFYERRRRVAGAAPPAPVEGATSRALSDIGTAIDEGGAIAKKVGTAILLGTKGEGPLAPAKRRKVGVGVVLGGIFPGLGLAYSAPWPVVAVASAVVLVGYKILAFIPFFSGLLTASFLAICAIASAVLGGLYAWQYNQAGKRATLGDEPGSAAKLLRRLGK